MAKTEDPGCDTLLKRDRPVFIGVVGSSITFGAGVRANESWPALLQARLRRTYPSVHVLNGAVRASSADFAALCWDEIWGSQWRYSGGRVHAPQFDLVLIDYTYTSSPQQQQALVDRVRSLSPAPAVGAVVYCYHRQWHRLIQTKNAGGARSHYASPSSPVPCDGLHPCIPSLPANRALWDSPFASGPLDPTNGGARSSAMAAPRPAAVSASLLAPVRAADAMGSHDGHRARRSRPREEAKTARGMRWLAQLPIPVAKRRAIEALYSGAFVRSHFDEWAGESLIPGWRGAVDGALDPRDAGYTGARAAAGALYHRCRLRDCGEIDVATQLRKRADNISKQVRRMTGVHL